MRSSNLKTVIDDSAEIVHRAAESVEASDDHLLEAVILIRATAEFLYNLAQNDDAELVGMPMLLAASQNLTQAANRLERTSAR